MSVSMDQKRKRELVSPPPPQDAKHHQDSTSTADTPTGAKKACGGLDGHGQTERPRSSQLTFIEDRNPGLFPSFEIVHETMPPTITEQERLVSVIREYTNGLGNSSANNAEFQNGPEHQLAALAHQAEEIIANDPAFKQYLFRLGCMNPQDHIAKFALENIATEVLAQRQQLDKANKMLTEEISAIRGKQHLERARHGATISVLHAKLAAKSTPGMSPWGVPLSQEAVPKPAFTGSADQDAKSTPQLASGQTGLPSARPSLFVETPQQAGIELPPGVLKIGQIGGYTARYLVPTSPPTIKSKPSANGTDVRARLANLFSANEQPEEPDAPWDPSEFNRSDICISPQGSPGEPRRETTPMVDYGWENPVRGPAPGYVSRNTAPNVKIEQDVNGYGYNSAPQQVFGDQSTNGAAYPRNSTPQQRFGIAHTNNGARFGRNPTPQQQYGGYQSHNSAAYGSDRGYRNHNQPCRNATNYAAGNSRNSTPQLQFGAQQSNHGVGDAYSDRQEQVGGSASSGGDNPAANAYASHSQTRASNSGNNERAGYQPSAFNARGNRLGGNSGGRFGGGGASSGASGAYGGDGGWHQGGAHY